MSNVVLKTRTAIYWDEPFRKIDLQLVKSRRVVGIRNVQLEWLWDGGCAIHG